MASTTVGLVYSVATGRLRSVVVPDNDAALAGITPLAGEAMLVITQTQYNAGGHQALVTAHTGITPSNDRYGIIDTGGNVIGAVVADPAVDQPPGFILAAHPAAAKGWLYLGGQFIATHHLPFKVAVPRIVGLRR